MKNLTLLIMVFALVLSFSVMAQDCCKDGKACDKCAAKEKCQDKAAACAECKDGKVCEKCAKQEYEMFMQMSAKFGQPGEYHKHLNGSIGSWNAKMKMFGMRGNVLHESIGVAERKWVMDGRFVCEEYKDSDNFYGMAYLGYDNMIKQYVSTWMDNMGTGIFMSKGTCDEAGKVFTLMSDEMPCPMTGQKMKWKNVTHVANDNEHTFGMYMVNCADGKEVKMMEIVYTRK